MKREEAATILMSLVEGRDPSSEEDLPDDTVFQRPAVIRALLVGCAAIKSTLARDKRRAQLPKRVGRTWTVEEDERLRIGFEANPSVEVLAASHQRSPNSIRARLERLRLVPPDLRTPRFLLSDRGSEDKTSRARVSRSRRTRKRSLRSSDAVDEKK